MRYASVLLLGFLVLQSCASFAEVKRTDFVRDSGGSLVLEFLNDRTFHFEYSPAAKPPDLSQPIGTSFYIAKSEDGTAYQATFKGPTAYQASTNEIETRDLRISVEPATLCFSVYSKAKQAHLTEVCPLNLQQDWKGLTLTHGTTQHLYGLGEQFLPNRFGSSNGDWLGQVRYPGMKDDGKGSEGHFGNEMVSYPPDQGASGAVGNTEFPILYATGPDGKNYSLFLDQIYKQRWDFRDDPWKVETQGATLRGFVTVATEALALRQAFMDLVGHPLVPPKKAFGLWVSEYGFESWTEIEDKLSTLRKNHFPIDGFVMDLQWFGNVKKDSDSTRMGTLDFDTSPEHFPNPKEKIRSFWHDQGIGLIPIEESYVGKALPEHENLAKQGFLVKATPDSGPLYINENPWWGLGGMIDWSNPKAQAYWHETKRKNLIDLGVVGHWTDLGEPEMYRHLDLTNGVKSYTIPYNEAETHNLFSLKWHEGIYHGYQKEFLETGMSRRPFILSRSGGPGMQRYGAAMWSGDIGSKFEDLATHYNVQMQMSWSGQDYFGADIGGFHREDLDGDLNELYTEWFADACAFDVPIRPHTENLSKKKNTAPDRVGDLDSNLANVRLRYELSPYYYSLAHRAHLYGEPVVPPLAFYYPTDSDSTIGDEKLVGKDLLIALTAKSKIRNRDIYLPTGDWIDYRSLLFYPGKGASKDQTLKAYPVYSEDLLTLPIFVKSGAIIPFMHVDDQTMNILGKRLDGITHTEMALKVFASSDPSHFTVYEDDGTSVGYLNGAVATTDVSQVADLKAGTATVTIAPTLGSYPYEDPNTGVQVSSPKERQYEVEMVVPSAPPGISWAVAMGDKTLPKLATEADYRAAKSGYFVKSDRQIFAKSAILSSAEVKRFDFKQTGYPHHIKMR
jgi:alpha-glucosidase